MWGRRVIRDLKMGVVEGFGEGWRMNNVMGFGMVGFVLVEVSGEKVGMSKME